MKTRILSLVLVLSMVLTLFAGLSLTASAADLPETGNYVIAAKVGDKYYAMKAAFGSKIVAKEIDVINGQVSASAADEYTVKLTKVGDYYTIFDLDQYYLTYSSSTNFGKSDSDSGKNAKWTITDGKNGTFRIANVGTDSRCIAFNGTQFGAYATSNVTSGSTSYYDVEILTINANVHDHTWSTWQHDEGSTPSTHTRTCTAADCPEEGGAKQTEECVFTAEVTKEPTVTEEGEKTYTCSECRHSYTETIPALGDAPSYVKVTEEPESWDGTYILVYENDNKAYVWNGLDAASCYVEKNISDKNTITADDLVTLTAETVSNGYSLLINGSTNNGKYLSAPNGGSNGMTIGTTAVANNIAYNTDSDSVYIKTFDATRLGFNGTTNNNRFRFYKTETLSSQSGYYPVQLYKLVEKQEPVNENLVTIYLVDETHEINCIHYWGPSAGTTYPGIYITDESVTKLGNDKGGHPVYMFQLDKSVYGNGIIFSKNGDEWKSGDLKWVEDDLAEGATTIVYYAWNGGNNIGVSTNDDFWLASTGVYTPATCTEGDYTTYTGYLNGNENKIYGENPATGHTAAEDWSKDKDNHWKICSVCGEIITETLGAHTFENGVCTVCGKKEDQTLTLNGWYVLSTKGLDPEFELSSISDTSTKYGEGAKYTEKPAGTMAFQIVEGKAVEGKTTYALKLENGNYLYWTNGNTLNSKTVEAPDDACTWTIEFDGDEALIEPVGSTEARRIAWNNQNEQERFAAYKVSTLESNQSNNYNAVQLVPFTPAPKIAFASLTLNDSIDINFYIRNLTEETLQNYVVSLTGPTGTDATYYEQFNTDYEIEPTPFTVTVDGETVTLYRVSYPICMKDYQTKITAQIKTADGVNVGEPLIYGVTDYIEKAPTIDRDVTYLCAALKTLCQLVENQLNEGTDNPDVSLAEGRDIEEYKPTITNVDGAGVSYYGASLLMKDRITLRMYFKFDSAPSEFEIKLDNQTIAATELTQVGTSKYYYYDITGLSATALADSHTFTLTKGDNVVKVENYSALSYAYNVLKNGAYTNAEVMYKIGIALINYYDFATAYFKNR